SDVAGIGATLAADIKASLEQKLD
ncbi:MAG: hypothetical protein RL556_440, partial [Actinomycetota bacterium]